MTTTRRRARRWLALGLAVSAGAFGNLPQTAQIVVWLVATLGTVVLEVAMVVDVHRDVLAMRRQELETGMNSYDAAEVAAALDDAIGHRARECFRLIAAAALMGAGVLALTRWASQVDSLLFVVVAVLAANATLDGIERRETREQLAEQLGVRSLGR